MSDMTLDEKLEKLSSAEAFLESFAVEYAPRVVHVNRLHVLQRFHDYLDQGKDAMPATDSGRRAVYKRLLERAYHDFVQSDALTEKVFQVFRMHEPQTTFVPLGTISSEPQSE